MKANVAAGGATGRRPAWNATASRLSASNTPTERAWTGNPPSLEIVVAHL
ncbi:hypothetical protein MBEHAL_0941 [Halarchaeum acidiphilum MH1-52-1]|uniref:Uncharacterized protein n=1 Tax=Halarchaeum acidiphilum MH1-52-1 TaxID=1261545 RepID=U2YEF6_9EURY|nr:hypothetical protein MBEHAL_0941 [Halarchaeum acidiphilum MH1-52-1]